MPKKGDFMKSTKQFKPSANHIRFAHKWLDFSKKKTLEEIAKEIGISYVTIWRWFQKKEFVDWINSKKDDLLASSLMARYRTAVRKAVAGDYGFSKMLFEMGKEYAPSLDVDLKEQRAVDTLEDKLEGMLKRLEDEKNKPKSGQ